MNSGDQNHEEGKSVDAAATPVTKTRLVKLMADTGTDIPSRVTFRMRLSDILALIPARYRADPPAGISLEEEVPIVFDDDLPAQLVRGKATMSVARLAGFINPALLYADALSDTATRVSLPLPAIVQAVGAQVFGDHMATKVRTRRYRIDQIQEPFHELRLKEYERRQIFSLPGRIEIEGAVSHLEEVVPLPVTISEGRMYLLVVDYETAGEAKGSLCVRPQAQGTFAPLREALPLSPESNRLQFRFLPVKDCPSPVLAIQNSSPAGRVTVSRLELFELLHKTGSLQKPEA